MLWLLLLLGCTDVSLVPPGGAGSKMKVCPSPMRLPPMGEDDEATFELGVQGRDTLVGLRWLPAQGSRLDVDVTGVGERFIGASGDRFPLRYALLDSVDIDTGTDRDDGVLRLFFRESASVDLWVQIVRHQELATLQAEQEQIESGVRSDPCAGLLEDLE